MRVRTYIYANMVQLHGYGQCSQLYAVGDQIDPAAVIYGVLRGSDRPDCGMVRYQWLGPSAVFLLDRVQKA